MKKIFKKIAALCVSVSMLSGNILVSNVTYAASKSTVKSESSETAPKTIYNFKCNEDISLDNALTTTSENPVSGYAGYENQFMVDPKDYPDFENATVIRRNKYAAGNVTYTRAAYANNGNLLDGKDGRDYFMSFDISSGATFYLVDNENKYWPSMPEGFSQYGKYSNVCVYGKHYDAGETVNIPCYGWDDSWDKTANRLFMNPSYFVVAWDNDATARGFTYTVDNKIYNVDGFSVADEGGNYNVEIDYAEGGKQIDVEITAKDLQAKIETNDEETFLLTQSKPVTVNYKLTSEGGDNSFNYSVTFTMKEKSEVSIVVNSDIVNNFNAKNNITDMYLMDNAGKTSEQTVNLLTYDENGYAKFAVYTVTYTDNGQTVTVNDVEYADLYNYIGVYDDAKATISSWNYTKESEVKVARGEEFFTDSHYFGVTGTAFDNASHIMTTRQFAPGRVKETSFDGDDASSSATEFKNWLCNDENTMCTITPNSDCVVYVAFSQKKSENHTKFKNDGWTFNNYEGIKIPSESLMSAYKNIKKTEWWMADSSYTYNGKPYVLTKVQYDTQSPTAVVNYCYIWSKEVKSGEGVEIPVGGSAFSGINDQDAPKVLINWQSSFLTDDVSGKINVGNSVISVNNSLTSMTYSAVANIGDTVSFAANGSASASISNPYVDELPCEVEVEIVSRAGSKVKHTVKLRTQPRILSITPSEKRSKFVANTGANQISLASKSVGQIMQSTVLFQKFEKDDNDILQPVYGDDGKYVFETVQKNVGPAFYSERAQHKFAHVGAAFKNMQYFTIPSNDAPSRRQTVYTNENTSYFNANGENKKWTFTDDDGNTSQLDYSQISNEYTNYILSDNEYFSFTASDSGTVYAAFESSSPNYSYVNGWKCLEVNVPLPEGHSEWSSVDADASDDAYPYQLGKIQYDSHKTEYHAFKYIYYKSFEANEKVSIPTSGLSGSDVGAFMVDWNDFISDDFGGNFSFNNNNIKLRSDCTDYTLNLINNEDLILDFTPNAAGTYAKISEAKVLASELPKTVEIEAVNYFGGKKTFNVTLKRVDAEKNKILNFDVASEYAIYDGAENGYNDNKGLISFSKGVYMIEENLTLGVSAMYSDRLTHKFTSDNTSDLFEGATYVRRPKKSGDYGLSGLSINSGFYSEDYSESGKYGKWISFLITSDADVYVGVPFDTWPNKPSDWQEDDTVELAGSKKVYKKSFSAGEYVSITSHGWDENWESRHESWDLPSYVVVWR